jgi:hypothetical protein
MRAKGEISEHTLLVAKERCSSLLGDADAAATETVSERIRRVAEGLERARLEVTPPSPMSPLTPGYPRPPLPQKPPTAPAPRTACALEMRRDYQRRYAQTLACDFDATNAANAAHGGGHRADTAGDGAQMGWGHAAGDRPAEVVTRMLLAAIHVEFSADPWGAVGVVGSAASVSTDLRGPGMVGLYKLKSVDPELEIAWFQPFEPIK